MTMFMPVTARERARRRHYEDWQPGDPLYMHPYEDTGERQTVRWLFQVHDDVGSIWKYNITATQDHCHECEVAWGVAVNTSTCWMCGGEGCRYACGMVA